MCWKVVHVLEGYRVYRYYMRWEGIGYYMCWEGSLCAKKIYSVLI